MRENKETVEVGNVVTVFEESKRGNKWKMAVVEGLIRGHDNVVRGAKVRVIEKGKPVRLSRPVQTLYPIEVRSEEDLRPVSSRETLTPEKGARRNVPKRAAALDAAWKTRAILDS